MAVEGKHLPEPALEYRRNVFALIFRICLILGIPEAYSFEDFAAICGNIEVALSTHR
jgi:hypothetical protein